MVELYERNADDWMIVNVNQTIEGLIVTYNDTNNPR